MNQSREKHREYMRLWRAERASEKGRFTRHGRALQRASREKDQISLLLAVIMGFTAGMTLLADARLALGDARLLP